VRPLLVLSDVHLSHGGCEPVAADLARLVASYPGHEIVLNGDLFTLSCDRPTRDPAESAASILRGQPTLRSALSRHLGSGSPITILAGNHDSGVQLPGVHPALLDVLERGADAPLRIEPWFVRRNGVHIEHGHVYDPDNAPTHPLAPMSFRTEPLGVILTRRFLGPLDGFVVAQRHEDPPLRMIRNAFDMAGPRAPLLLLRFSGVLVMVCAETAVHSRLASERSEGDLQLTQYGKKTGVADTALRALLDAGPAPTHASFRRTFMRLYFDRMLATLAIPASFLVAPSLGAGALVLAAASLGYLLASHHREGSNRYRNRMPDHLRAGASLVRRVTGAHLVIFGHTHREDEADGYLNSGSFQYTTRTERPFLYVDEYGRAERRLLPSAS
jgi:predicted phosphodiesterase